MPTLNDLAAEMAAEIFRSTAIMNTATTALVNNPTTIGTPIDAQQFADLITSLRAASDTLVAAIALYPPLAPEDGEFNTTLHGEDV